MRNKLKLENYSFSNRKVTQMKLRLKIVKHIVKDLPLHIIS